MSWTRRRSDRGEVTWRAAVLDAIQDGVYVVDDQLRVVEINDAFVEILGFGRDGLPYPAPFPWWPDPDTDPEARRLVERSLDESGSGRFTVPCRRADGRRVWLSVSFSTATDPDGGRVSRVGTIRDVSEELAAAQRANELANEQLRQTDRAFRLLADYADEMLSRHSPDGTYRYLSPSTYRLLGWLPEQLVGHDPLAYVHPEDVPTARDVLREVAQHPVELLIRVRRADGSWCWMEIHGRHVVDPETGEVEMEAVGRDVDARVRAEQQLQRFRAIAEQAGDVVGMADAGTLTVSYLNPAGRALFGFGPDQDVSAVRFDDLVTATGRATLAEAFAAARAGGLWTGEIELAGRDGGGIPAAQTLVAHRDDRGGIEFFSTIARDLRPQRAAQRRIHEEEQRYRALVEQVDVGIFRLDTRGRYVFGNERLAQIVNCSRPDLLDPERRHRMLRLDPTDRERLRAQVALGTAERRSWTAEFRVLLGDDPDPEIRWVRAGARPLRDASGAFVGHLGTCLDITELRAAEDDRRRAAVALAEREIADGAAARMRALVTGLAAVVWEADARTGRYTFVSDHFAELLGYPVSTLIGQVRLTSDVLHPEEVAEVRDGVEAAIRAGEDHAVVYRARAADGRILWLHDVVHVERDATGEPSTLHGVIIDITEQKRAERASALLAEIGRVHARGGSFAEQLAGLARTVAVGLGDVAVVYLTESDGALRPTVAAAPGRPRIEPAVLALPGTEAGPDSTRLAELGLRTSLVVPLVSEDRPLGQLAFLSAVTEPDAPGRAGWADWNDIDEELAVEVARRVSALVSAEQIAARERALHRVTAALAAAQSLREVADVLFAGMDEVFGPAGQSLYVLDPERGALRVVHAIGYRPEVLRHYATIALDDAVPHAAAARTGEPVWIRAARDWRRFPGVARHTAAEHRAGACALPMRVAGRVVAVLGASFAGDRAWHADEREFAATVVTAAAQAVHRAMDSDRRRDIAEALQHSLLPSAPPVLDRLALATRYLPGAIGVQAGGDWYDVVELDRDRTAIVVGDVVGQGAPAAAIMGQLRSALSALLVAGSSGSAIAGPGDALAQLNRYAALVPGARASTAVCMVIDTRYGRARWARAGHPPPLLVDRAGSVRLLDEASGPLLGAFGTGEDTGPVRYPEGEVDFEAGDTVVLYTDGLVERRGEVIDAGMRRVMSEAGELPGAEPSALVDGLLAAVVPDGQAHDDIAVVAARCLPPPLVASLPARPSELAAVRRSVRRWAEAAALSDELLDDLQLALGEAASNAVEHAYAGRDEPGAFEYALHRLPDGGGVAVRVTDFGRWRPPPLDRGFRGRGLEIIDNLAQDLVVEHGDGAQPDPGTTLRFTLLNPDAGDAEPHRLCPPESPDDEPGRPVAERPPSRPASLRTHDEPAALRVAVRGDLDLAAVQALRTELLGLVDAQPDKALVLDLRETSYLLSAGLAVLLEINQRARAVSRPLRVLAPDEGPVSRVLALTGLDRLPGVATPAPAAGQLRAGSARSS
jgi:anti-anti-sigma factor